MGNCLKLQRSAASWVDDDEWEVDERMPAVEKMERVEVKIKVTKRQVQELLQKAGRDCKGSSAEKLLAELMDSGIVCCQHETRGHWRPSLQSITEAEEQ
ncbi:uncharacterized protein LOC100831821 [Brachypodium distachyon]|uniref:Uncharacterized protein n=1 Tax=Brachypodium distachyon TaxID=15368 RepID=I1HSF7_BRADI|nr:uncharacterized protein LOC100831821 [Brachypodium distachyon]KQK10147.1 hypothetical protein BRADI_2g52300v3 [Brachypodium distachyon]|eukprot:XP_003564388.1 uncharacterized protein LOC100831821 [Brachypodium distachyon]